MTLRTLLLLAAALGAGAQQFYLKPGDRVVFFGDSITDQRLYTTFVETYAVTRYPKGNFTFTHSGWGGDRVSGGAGGPIDVRLWRDVLPYDPTVVTLMLGMNDGRYRAFEQPIFDEYEKGYRHIVASLKRRLPGARITAIQPSPYDDVTRKANFEGGYNAVLLRYGAFLKQLAAAEGLHWADMNTPVVAALNGAKSIHPEDAARLIPDRVHPGPSGHLLMAQALLESWSAPALVSEVEFDGAQKTATVQKQAKVSEVQATAKGFAWTQLDEALPMPVDLKDPLVALALKASSFTQALNQQLVRVTKLATGNYRLRVDGAGVGSFTAAQLKAGINLTEFSTPMLQQAADVHALTLQHAAIHNTRWRQVQVPLEKTNYPETFDAMKALDELEEELVEEQRKTAQPKPHRFELTLE
jgi:lysophospholipase L1-like esterase